MSEIINASNAEETDPLPVSSLAFPVVGIGASAGGLPALLRFFEPMPQPCGMAFVVVMHLSPKHESNVAEILQRNTHLKVTQVVEETHIAPEHVYVIPPGKDLRMSGGHLALSEPMRETGPHVAIDLFFRTLGEAHADRAFAIVMSGLGSDGALGVARIKECGGVSFAQSFDDAEYDNMPRAAVATGAVDFVMPVAEMAPRLCNLWDNLKQMRLSPETPADGQLVQRLEDEIVQLKEQLRATIETSDNSTEELKASNEELQAINEELRSASEELETGKEELQSINEELTTVNYQLKLKVEETVQINDDLQNLIASTDIAVVFVDAAMRIKRFTLRATDLFNLIPSDVGRSLLDITYRLDSEWLTGAIEQAFRKLRVIEREVAGEDGRTWLSRVLPYRTVDNKIDGVVLTFVDITSRLKAEEKLKVNEERLRIAAETVRDYAIFTMDDAGVITTWNVGAQRAFGYRQREAVGHSFGMVFTAEDRACRLPEAELARALETGSSSDDRWYVKKDGTRFYCSGETTSFRSGDVTGFAKIARDMTGSKLMEARRDEELSRQTQVRLEAEASNRTKDEFLAVMSHELKHPLNLIHVNAELLSRTPEVNHLPAVKRAADIIRRTVAGQARIIDDLLDLSRARTGKMMMTLVAAPLDAIVTRVVDAARHDAKKKGVTIMQLIAPGLNCTALCDPVRVEQIVWNLLSNAVKFTEPGGEVTVRVTGDGKEASIEVTDTGRGIAPAFLPQVFTMFHQERRGVPDGEGGMGIGLALVKELTEAQGGRVEARSQGEGLGSTFVVRLPLEHGASLPMNADRIGNENLDGLRILAVDDSAEVLEPFAEMMRMDGAHVVEAHSGAEALRALDAEPFDLLISDIGMPQMDGYQLIDAVRQRNGVHRIVAIALTGYGRASDAQRASEVGFDAHLSKPTSVDDFKTLVGKLREKGVLQ